MRKISSQRENDRFPSLTFSLAFAAFLRVFNILLNVKLKRIFYDYKMKKAAGYLSKFFISLVNTRIFRNIVKLCFTFIIPQLLIIFLSSHEQLT